METTADNDKRRPTMEEDVDNGDTSSLILKDDTQENEEMEVLTARAVDLDQVLPDDPQDNQKAEEKESQVVDLDVVFGGTRNSTVLEIDAGPEKGFDDDGEEADVENRTACLFLISQVILFLSGIMLIGLSFFLAYQDITQLVGESVPQLTVGLGLLTFIIFGLGFVANKRNWACGFSVQAIILLGLIFFEVLAICACAFQKHEIFSESDIFWKQLDDDGKSMVMANWKCCDWENTCDTSDSSSIYHTYQEFQGTACLDATDSDMNKWVIDVCLIFGFFAVFQLLYVIYTCTYQLEQDERKSCFARWRQNLSTPKLLGSNKPTNAMMSIDAI